MRKTLLSFSLLFVSFPTLFAKNNRLEVGVGHYKFFTAYKDPDPSFIESFNINYSRSILKNTHIYTNYLNAPNASAVLMRANPMSENDDGKLDSREKYHFLDLGVGYQLYNLKNHSISINGALSIAYGTNVYQLYSVWYDPSPYPGGHSIYMVVTTRKETYFGGTINLKYDYVFWKDRLNIDINLGGRKYLSKNNAHLEMLSPNLQHIDPNIPEGRHDFPFHLNYGIHVGFNF